MIIYVDENMPSVLAQGFDILQEPMNHKLKEPVRVKSIKEVFGAGTQDEDWIPKAGEEGACVITQDLNIRRSKHQRALCEQHGLGMFYFHPPSKTGFAYWDMLKLMVKHWEEITRIATREDRPFSFKITARGQGVEPMD
ncbi:MAG: hypothetical protein IPH04_01150 [Saprospirales bacterium]|nr:hypothetical protein [Saprospirales bacterium]